MSNFPPSDPPAQNNSAFAAAVERAQQVASKLKSSTDSVGGPVGGIKRSLGEPTGGPDIKRPSIPGAIMDGGAASEEINVPDKMVGMIIGRGGEQITKLQAESGCKIQMAPDSGGQPDRKCTLTGSGPAIGKAKAMINAIIAGGEMKAGQMGGGMGGGGGGGGGAGFYETMIPGHKVGLIIGKGGETIKMLQEQTGAKIAIIQDNAEQADQKPLRISGQPQAVEIAKARVNELLNQEQNGFGGRGARGGRGGPFRGMPPGRGGPMMGRGRGRGGGSGWPSGFDNGSGERVEFVSVPGNKVGLVIGKGGETIKSINQTSGAHCEVDKKAPQDAPEKSFIIKGSPEAVEKAKQMVLEKIGLAPGSNYGSFPGQTYGGNSGSFNGQQPGYQPQQNPYQSAPAAGGGINPATGQPDYSAQWAEYYRSLGMIREAEMVEQQQAAVAQTAAPQPAAAPASQPQVAGAPGGGAADYSAQWVEYYRSVGKTKEAEAIEAQMRAKSGGQPGYPAAQFPGQQPGYPVQGYYPPQPQQGGYPGYE